MSLFRIFQVCVISIFVGILSAPEAFAQAPVVVGRVVSEADNKALPGANISLRREGDTVARGAVTERSGNFRIEAASAVAGKYILTVRSIGFAELKETLNLAPGDTLRLGRLEMSEADIQLSEVNVEGRVPPVEVKGDTTEYSADAYKVQANATTEDLIKKMPGIQVDASGNVQAQGERVQRVLVDGKPFFGDDPKVAIRNLPAEMVDRIQVVDGQSDQARFTGFDDGQREKILNVVTRADRRKGIFGRLNAGYGTDNRYSASGTMNFFDGSQRISILGLSNNVNQQNFSTEDIVGAMTGGAGGGRIGRMMSMANLGGMASQWSSRMMAGRFGDLFVPQAGGITQAHSLGLNYTDSFSESVDISASYFVNLSDNDQTQQLEREFFFPGGSQFNDQFDTNNTRNLNHRFNIRVEYTIDSSNLIVFTPRFSIQQNSALNLSDGSTVDLENRPINGSTSRYSSDINGYSFGGDLLYRYKFLTPGRTFSINLNSSVNNNSGDIFNFADNRFFSNGAFDIDSLRQFTPLLNDGVTLSSNIDYTEPLHEGGQLRVRYNISRTANDAERNAFDRDELGEYSILNQALSNTFQSTYIAQRAGLTYTLNVDKFRFSFGSEFQHAELTGDQVFPTEFAVRQTFRNVLPSMSIAYTISPTNNIRLFYRTFTTQPNIQQLQNVIDNRDPLRLATGNPDLDQEFYHSIFTRYINANPLAGTSFFALLSGQFAFNKIANASFIAPRDTVLEGGIPMPRGSQLSAPINIDGYMNLRAYSVYSFPFDLIRSNLNVNAGATFNREITLINADTNTSNNLAIETGFGINSNISEDIDFSINARIGMNFVRNSLQEDLNTNFFSQVYNVKANYIFWEGFSIGTELVLTVNSGLGDQFNQTIPFWNVNVGKQILDKKAEIRLTVFDVLRENNSINREVTPTFIQDSQVNVLQQYVMLSFTYFLRSFQGQGGGGRSFFGM